MLEYVKDYDRFKEICIFIKKNINIIGLDTEFSRHYTYYPKLLLIQLVYNYKNIKYIYIIDVKLIFDITPFNSILKSNKIKKIFFSCNQDIDAFYFYTKHINNIEDIQLMINFSGYKSDFSYLNAIKNILDINFKKNKKIQSGDWEQRPLTQEQLDYAGMDVFYIFELYYKLLDIISEKNYSCYKNELKYIIKFKNKKYLINNAWKKSKFLLHKKPMEYVLLFKELSSWREEKAILENKIRNNIINDDMIDIIIKNKPKQNLKNLYSYTDILNLKQEYKKEIVNIIFNFYTNYKQNYNFLFYTIEKGFIYKDKLLDIYTKIKNISETNNIFIEKTISKTDIIFLIMKYENKRSILYGWKYDLFNDIFNL